MTVRFKSQTEYQRSFTLPRSSTASALPCDPPAGSDSSRNSLSARGLRSSAHRKQQKPPTRPESVPEPPAGPRPPAHPLPPRTAGSEAAADGDSDKPRPLQGHSQPRPSTPVPAAAASGPLSAEKGGHVTSLRVESKATGHMSGWRKPLTATSPLLCAEQVFSRSISPYRRKPISMETEYGRSFQGLIPPSGPRLRNHLDHEREPLFHTHTVNRRSWEEEPPDKPRLHHDTRGAEDTPPPLGRRTVEGKLAGAALQVTELRQRALMYRRRAWGANFSRNHLGQLLSDQNALWEPSVCTGSTVDAPPLARGPSPDNRSMDALDLASVSSGSRSAASEPGTTRTQRQRHAEDERRSNQEEDQLPPSRPRTRTPSGLSTPAAGGARLLAKQRNTDVSHHQTVQRNASAVSMATEAGTPGDLPVKRKEAWPERVLPDQHKPCCSTQVCPVAPPSAPPPLHAIQGSMRHPEFQHNGELGVRLRETSCSGGSGGPEEDRLSVMSWRSAASCSAASVVLERAQKRHKNFWGKH